MLRLGKNRYAYFKPPSKHSAHTIITFAIHCTTLHTGCLSQYILHPIANHTQEYISGMQGFRQQGSQKHLQEPKCCVQGWLGLLAAKPLCYGFEAYLHQAGQPGSIHPALKPVPLQCPHPM